eukprot:9493034-Alexandrium_andersonii.AAC.1
MGPTINLASGSPQGVVEHLAEVARAVNQLHEQQVLQSDQLSMLTGRVVGGRDRPTRTFRECG